MRASLAAAAAALLLLGACRRPPPKDSALYVSRDGAVSARVPASWRVLEGLGGAQRATFLGPADGPRPYSQSIGVYFYGPGSAFASPQDYARGQRLEGARVVALQPLIWKGQAAYALTDTRLAARGLHSKRQERRREKTLLVSRGGGFYAVTYSAPQDAFAAGEPVFESFLQSLKVN